LPVLVFAQDTLPLRARRYCVDLIKIDTTNPPGRETAAAEYIQLALAREGIPSGVMGEPARKNVVARLKGSGGARPLLLMAHTDVVPADPAQWTVPPFAAIIREGFLYGRGAQDDKCLLAAEMAVFVELKRKGTQLRRDVILLGESDEEAGSLGIQWMIRNAWNKIDAEFAINEGGYAMETKSAVRVFQIQTSEKIPTRVELVGKGTAGHGSLPRPDNPVYHLARAITRLTEADQPVRMNTTTRRYFQQLARLPEYAWLAEHLAPLENSAYSTAAANRIREKDPELDAVLRTTVSPTMLQAGMKINVIPNRAESGIDVRRLPNESREEVVARFRQLINDPSVEVVNAGGQEMPSTEPSSLTTPLYLAMQNVFAKTAGRTLVVPFMSRGATDGSYLRQKGMAVYGAPVFLRLDKESRAHGNDERLPLTSLASGTELLLEIVLNVASDR
jgi:acetylornithine deacetylase/succinyl-diaminopimelate desuccinylase-like protein